MHILNTYPHDELFQISEDELYANALGILQLQERARSRPVHAPRSVRALCHLSWSMCRATVTIRRLRARIQQFL